MTFHVMGDTGGVSQPAPQQIVAQKLDADPVKPAFQGQSPGRTTMTQPNVYWTLTAPFVTIIGLYSNVPQGGQLDATQVNWLQSDLSAAGPNSMVILTMHHPPISSDSFHDGSAYMFGLLDAARDQSGRTRIWSSPTMSTTTSGSPHPRPRWRQLAGRVHGNAACWAAHTVT